MATPSRCVALFSLHAEVSRRRCISSEPNLPRISCDESGQICFDGSFRLTFKVLRTLVGPKVKSPVFFKQASAQPVTGLRYLVVVSSGSEKDQSVEWRGSTRTGLSAEIADGGLQDALQSILARSEVCFGRFPNGQRPLKGRETVESVAGIDCSPLLLV